jgi:hypothetical protein
VRPRAGLTCCGFPWLHLHWWWNLGASGHDARLGVTRLLADRTGLDVVIRAPSRESKQSSASSLLGRVIFGVPELPKANCLLILLE